MKSKRKSILLLGNYRPSLTLARKLRSQGYKIIVGSHGCDKGCSHSNAVSQIWDHLPLELSPETFIGELREFVDHNPDLVAIFPVAEEYVRLIAEHEERFKSFPPIVSMSSELVKNCLDKNYMMHLANECNAPTAAFASTNGKNEFARAIKVIGYPFIVRPKDSTKRLAGKKALFIEDAQSLADANDEMNLDRLDLLLQKKFSGMRHNIYFAADNGRIVRCLHAVITRTDSVDDTGLAVDGLTLEPLGDLVEQTERLLAALDYSGIGCAQFLVNTDNGETSFLEINPRIAGNHALPEYAGLELGNYLLDMALGKSPDQRLILGKAGIRYCWTSGDLVGIKGAYLRGEISAATAINWCLRAFATAARSDVHMVFCRKDPMPALTALWQVVPRIARWKKPADNSGENTIYQDATRKPT